MDTRSRDLYRQTLAEGKEAVHNIRVMVVGHYGVGKTTLTRRLLRKKVDITARDSTDGIDVHVRKCKVSLDDYQWTMLKKGKLNKKRIYTVANFYTAVGKTYMSPVGDSKHPCTTSSTF